MTDIQTKPASTKAGLFPRSYIMERIEARIGTIQRTRGTAQRMADELIVRRAVIRASELAAKATYDIEVARADTRYADRLSRATTPEAVADAVLRHQDTIRGLGPEPKVEKTNRVLAGDPEGWSVGYGDAEASEVKQQLRLEAEERKEEADLAHALTYLKETPVDTFSLTGLKQLGLLDAIKFRL